MPLASGPGTMIVKDIYILTLIASSLFTRLPAEIQMLIWDFYNTNQPALRHCFGLFKKRGVDVPIYAALDENSRLFLDLTTRFAHHQLGSPVRAIVPLPASVAVRSDTHPPYAARKRYLALHNGTYYRNRPTTTTLINFERDTLYFEDARFSGAQSSRLFHLIPSCLALALPAIPSHSRYDESLHWVFSARKLAFNLYTVAGRMDDNRIALLRSFRRLRNIFLIAQQLPGSLAQRSGGFLNPSDGFKGFMNIYQFNKRWPNWTVPTDHGEQAADKLKSVFAENRMPVSVELVVDLY
ncbi:hypothetical protein GGR57DRAFT_412573 [Xylariaceae sp. FL1272]|nr:hypothetical protein GGR57DRAFT_412573 [Xylariaceae sp. FL1272]